MAPSSLMKAFTLFTAASVAGAAYAPSNSTSSSSICSTASNCIPFTIDVTWGQSNAGGFSRNAILTNGTIPGPPLKLKVGECVDFTVINNMDKPTGVHFHGIRQYGTPWADGTPGLSQYSIKPGSSYMYRWTADASGVYFYHAHYKGQMMDGLYGAILIKAADGAQKPFSQISSSASDIAAMEAAEAKVEPVFASDWSQYTFDQFFNIEKTANIDNACTDSIILNGKGAVYCPGVPFLTANAAPQTPQILNGSSLTAKGCIPASNFLVQGNFSRNLAALPAGAYDQCTPTTGANFTYTVDKSAGWAAFSFINPGGFAILKVTIDNHKLYVYEWNGNYVVPQVADEVIVSNGDRYSFFVKLDQPVANYQIRVANAGLNQVISGFGVLSYSGAGAFGGVSVQNYGGQNTTAVLPFIPPLGAPFPASAPAATADATFVLDIMKTPNQPASWAWTLSGVESYDQSRDDETPPLLYQSPASVPASDLILKTQSNQWVDLIIKIAGPLAEPHPIHKHANKFYVIGSGVGNVNWTTAAGAAAAGLQLNLHAPPYVDGFTSPPAEGSGAWMIFRYQVNTPGAWFLHCHVQTHFSGGMAVAILDAVDNFPQVPSDVGKVCPGSGTSNSTSSSGSGSGYGSKSGSATTTTAPGTISSSTSSATPSPFSGDASTTTRVSWVLGGAAALLALFA